MGFPVQSVVEKAQSALSFQLCCLFNSSHQQAPYLSLGTKAWSSPWYLLLKSPQGKLSPGAQKRQVADRAAWTGGDKGPLSFFTKNKTKNPKNKQPRPGTHSKAGGLTHELPVCLLNV